MEKTAANARRCHPDRKNSSDDPDIYPVRVKGGMSLRNGMWHGLRNDIIMQNVKYRKWRKD